MQEVIPAIMSRELLLPPVVMLRQRMPAAVPMPPSGPGAANLLSGVADAYFDSLPVIFITGQLNTYEYSGITGLRQQGFQEIDMVSMAKPVTKYAVQVRDPKNIVRELNLAWQIANTGRKGPVLIDLPMNVQRGEVEDPVYDMEFSEEEIETAVYGKMIRKTGQPFTRMQLQRRILLMEQRRQNIF